MKTRMLKVDKLMNTTGINEIAFGASALQEPILRISLNAKNAYGEKLVKRYKLTTATEIHKANAFLRSLNTGINIRFESYKQYYKLVENLSGLLKVPFLWINSI